MKAMRKFGALLRTCIVAVSLIFAGTTAVQAQDDLEQAVEVRQSLLKLIRWNLGPLGNMARGRVPVDIEQVGTNAARIEGLFGMMGDAFATDTRGVDVETEALDRIWDESAAFAEKIAASQQAAADLAEIAASGDEDGARAGIGALARTCGSCHDDYRVD